MLVPSRHTEETLVHPGPREFQGLSPNKCVAFSNLAVPLAVPMVSAVEERTVCEFLLRGTYFVPLHRLSTNNSPPPKCPFCVEQ